jgi:CTP synthase
MIKGAHWCRKNNVPFLGVCLGMQLAVVEFARNICGMPKAGSSEFHEQCEQPVIIYMPEIDKTKMGGTMRLGKRPTVFQPGTEWSRLRKLYGNKQEIWERHRHRYEVNPDMVEQLEKGGLSFVGKDESGERMEIVELKDHKWFVGVQFHPEYLSRVLAPSKTFLGFFAAAAGCLEPITELFKDSDDLSHRKLTVNSV